ncbi:MAG TPA: 16S rRNA (cytidine(1402)-2'-O)-methyltransferase [Pseudomonadota bacterium]|nr:16S rRNA (cytidine(1402)-2'-O)-methyltransferase [Pseudomonadota bacterium]
MSAKGRLFVVGTPIGNMEDVTLRALRVLATVEILAAEDTRKALHLLSHHQIAVGNRRLVSFFAGNETAREQELVSELLAGKTVALVTDAGMPGISDPGQGLVAAAHAQKIPVEVVPGPSAVLHALVVSGLPTQRFLFVGFPPRDEGPRLALFGSLRQEPGTLVFYESKERVAHTVGDLAKVLGERRQAVVARELSKLFEETLRGTLGELSQKLVAQPVRGEITLVVAGAEEGALCDGEAAQLDVEQEVRKRLLRGETAKDISTALTVLTGQPRRKLYQLALHVRATDVSLSSASEERS